MVWGAATIGVVVAGIQYLTARDNEQQVVAAKRRLFNVVPGWRHGRCFIRLTLVDSRI